MDAKSWCIFPTLKIILFILLSFSQFTSSRDLMKWVSSLVRLFFLIIEKGSHANGIIQEDLHLLAFTPHYSMAMIFEWVRKEEPEVTRERKLGREEIERPIKLLLMLQVNHLLKGILLTHPIVGEFSDNKGHSILNSLESCDPLKQTI